MSNFIYNKLIPALMVTFVLNIAAIIIIAVVS